jgi:hypothetical protein
VRNTSGNTFLPKGEPQDLIEKQQDQIMARVFRIGALKKELIHLIMTNHKPKILNMKNRTLLSLLIWTLTYFSNSIAAQDNVGIGTTTPLTKLTVQTSTNNYGITHTDGAITVGTYVGLGKAWFGTLTNQPLAFFTNNSNEQMTLLTNGNLGIGTATPMSKLHIKGSANISQLIIDASSAQSNGYPLLNFRTSNGQELLGLHADDSTNIFLGLKAGKSNVVGPQGINNIFIGNSAGYSNTNGRDNTILGTNALFLNTKGSRNIAIGTNALFAQSFNGGGGYYFSDNVAIGYEALYNNQPTSPASGANNTAIGTYALYANVTGSRNIAIGSGADVGAANLTNAIAIGHNAIVSSSNSLVLGGTGSAAVKVGIGVNNPQAALDVNGDVIFRSADLEVADGVNLALDVNTSKFSYYRLSGPSADYVVAGISLGIDGRRITLMNNSGFSMQLNNKDGNAATEDQIITGNNGILTLDSLGMVTLIYDGPRQKWIVNNASKGTGDSAWNSMGENIYFNNYVGIGTEIPTSPLSIQTAVDEPGFTHWAGVDAITIASSVSTLAGSIGTITDHVFSLNAGGEGKLHVWPDGDVVIGDESVVAGLMETAQTRMNQFDSKLTVMTALNETGYTHIGGDNQIIVNEAIGGVAASVGTMTNNTFRLKTNTLGRLHILGDGRVVVSPNDYAAYGQFTVHTANNTHGLVQVGGDGQVLSMRIGGSSGSIGTWTPHSMRLVSNGVARLNIDANGNVAIGIAETLPGYMFAVNGNMKAKELVIETTGWPDYVFGETYQPMPLRELEHYIRQHHHLPGIPSAAEAEQHGVAVGEMLK